MQVRDCNEVKQMQMNCTCKITSELNLHFYMFMSWVTCMVAIVFVFPPAAGEALAHVAKEETNHVSVYTFVKD